MSTAPSSALVSLWLNASGVQRKIRDVWFAPFGRCPHVDTDEFKRASSVSPLPDQAGCQALLALCGGLNNHCLLAAGSLCAGALKSLDGGGPLSDEVIHDVWKIDKDEDGLVRLADMLLFFFAIGIASVTFRINLGGGEMIGSLPHGADAFCSLHASCWFA